MEATEQVSIRWLTAQLNGLRAELRFFKRELREEMNDLRDQFDRFVAERPAPTHMDTTAKVKKTTIEIKKLPQASIETEKSPVGPVEESIGEQVHDLINQIDICIGGSIAVEAAQQPVSVEDGYKSSTIMAVDSAVNQAERMRFYEVEPSIYGLLVMPSRPLGRSIWLLLLLHYVLIFWLSASIQQATARARKELMVEINSKLCTQNGDSWDCAQPLLKRMADFKSLDRNMDGHWSLEEATAVGLVSQFRALHEVALDSASVLREIAPPISEVPDVFCSIGLPWSVAFGPVIGWEDVVKLLLDYLGDQGIDFPSTFASVSHHLADCMNSPSMSRDPIGVDYHGMNVSIPALLCLADFLCRDDFKGTTAKSSEDEYRRSTGYHSFFPEPIYEFLFDNLLQPCFLIDSELCANAEITSDFLRKVTRWKELGSAERVQQCSIHVREVCPRILGDQFQTFAKDVSESCGQRQYETEIVADVTSGAFSLNESDLNIHCMDDDSALPAAMRQLAETNTYSGRIVKILGSKGVFPTTCQQLTEWRWCHYSSPMPNTQPDGSIKVIELGRLLAAACPQTCCKEDFLANDPSLNFTPLGCDPQCHHGYERDHRLFSANSIRYTCFGFWCARFSFQEEQFGQLRISTWLGWYSREHNSKIVIYSAHSVWVNVVNVFAGGGEDCPQDSLEIDGVRVCQENRQQHKQVFVPIRSRGSFEIILHVSSFSICPQDYPRTSDECNWELVIVDAGERDEATISKVSFEQQIRFGMGPQGVRSWDYASFLTLILAVWVSFMWQELMKIIHLAFFLLQCPDIGNVRRRLCFLMTVALPRLFIWAWVLHVGVMLLLVSSDFVEIVLNAVALGFILEIDEILYNVMVPLHVQDVLTSLDKFRWPSARGSVKHLGDVQVVSTAVMLLLVVLGLVTWEYYRPNGYFEAAQQVDCVCDLRGPHCLSGVLNRLRQE